MRNIFLFFLICLVVLGGEASSQQIYKTHKGLIKITAVIHDSTYSIVSNQLQTTLIRETMDLEMRLDISQLALGIDSLREYIRKMNNSTITFKGKLKGSFLPEGNSLRPPPKNKVVGKLYAGDIKKQLIFYVTIEPVSKDGGIISAILSGNFSLPVRDFHLEKYIEGLRDEIAIDFKQDLF